MPFNWIPRLHHALVAVLLLAVAVLVAGSTRPVTASAYPATGSTVAREAQSITTGELPASAAAGPVVYLTFDDGPHPQWTPQILAVLARYQARATFFAIG
ncbi:MAG: polysaccharide deacetylase family protein, partial [Chloroflexota bacterium]|nr:polysaccharide deacetylase family protein [Chloroflexota bacterium]